MPEVLEATRTALVETPSDVLLDGIIAEYAAWTTEIFDDQRVAELDAGISVLARRAKIKADHARSWVAEQARKRGVEI